MRDIGRTATPPFLDISGITLRYKTSTTQITATYRVSFSVEEGERFVLLGPSGCGKSSILKAIGGYIKPTEGSIELKGAPVVEPGPDRMMVFQEFDQLLAWKTVLQNVIFPMVRSGNFTRREALERAHHYLRLVHLTNFADAYPHMLSGGMKQRVAIARGMAMAPAVLLMDEPYASLDALTRQQMQQELLQLWKESKVTLIFVTHSIAEAVVMGSRILLLSPHPGRVREELDGLPPGTPPEMIALLERRIHDLLFHENPAVA